MLSKFLNSNLLYIQIWENRVKITTKESGIVFDEEALIVLTTNSKGEDIVGCAGNKVKSFYCEKSFKIIKPYSHPRTLISDFIFAEKLLQYAVKEVLSVKFLTMSPLIVIHPMEKLEGGLTSVESRAFQELALGAGARDAIVHEGDELNIMDFDFMRVKEKMNPKEVTSLPNKVLKYVGITVFTAIVFSPIIYDFFA